MRGRDVADMFGDTQLLKLEEQHKMLEERLKEKSAMVADMKADPESDTEEIKRLEAELHVVREMMREQDRVIRKAAQEWGNKRGPVTLH